MKMILLVLALGFDFFTPDAVADSLQNIEVRCWSSGQDESGNFRCDYLMISGYTAEKNEFRVPSLAAIDGGGEKTAEQANRACAAMGYGYAASFRLERAPGAQLQTTLAADGLSGELFTGRYPGIEHLVCFQ